MTALVEQVAAVLLALGCAAIPFAIAHYGRNPDDRLDRWGLAVLGLAMLAPLVIILSWAGRVFPSAIAGVAAGVLVGLFGLAAYGVLERLVRPLVWRVER